MKNMEMGVETRKLGGLMKENRVEWWPLMWPVLCGGCLPTNVRGLLLWVPSESLEMKKMMTHYGSSKRLILVFIES